MTWDLFQERLHQQRQGWVHAGMPDVAGEMLGAQGKEWRARLVFLTASLLGSVTPAHQALACAIECVHTASLLHDDVLDQGNMRRGRPCTHRVWGNAAAILSGDWWLAKGFSILLQVGNLDVIARVQRAMIQLVQGQLADCLMTQQADQSAYLTMIEDKTACLFAVAAAASGMLSGACDDQVSALEAYGTGVGMSYQLKDDASEYGETPEKWDSGHDFFQEKATYPVMIMREQGQQGEYAHFLGIQKQARILHQEADRDSLLFLGAMPGLESSLQQVHRCIQPFVAETSALAETYREKALLALSTLWPVAETRHLAQYSHF